MKTVWTNGCFDILHRGHVEMFKFAKSLGDELIVGLDTDEKVKESKGSDRPFNNLEDRELVVSSIRYVDKTISFNSQKQLEDLIKTINPDILVVGSDWEGKYVVGAEYAKDVIFFPRIDGYSTTKVLENDNLR
jgi:rfaE bifunctional protein nucleotidyltransferase chain/domain|tara:strand:- start:110 stop:508 length:399 start_codon:yes stop_codon:yes gene_type:complete